MNGLQAILNGVVPQHIGIIMDGNRRFAKRLMLQPWKGHEWGAKKLEEVLEWCKELKIRAVTLYTLSLENLSGRPREELAFLFSVMKNTATSVLKNPDHPIHRNRVRVRILGRKDMLPKDLSGLVTDVENATKGYSQFSLNFALAYGGRQELVDAFRKMSERVAAGELQPCSINEDVIKQHLYTAGVPDPDLIIRTGGERRLSNFLLFQSAYSELVFMDKAWPEFSKEDFLDAIRDFQQRQRRFGK